jgi:hypothetical protein
VHWDRRGKGTFGALGGLYLLPGEVSRVLDRHLSDRESDRGGSTEGLKGGRDLFLVWVIGAGGVVG